MKNIALYVRVSSQEQAQHGLSVETQEKALREYAQENNYNVVGVYTDAGISAHVNYKKRPALMKMISDCQTGKIELVCFTKLDRFTRNVSNYYSIMELMNNVPWRAIWEDYETETSSGIFKVNIMLSIAQAESDRTSERIKNVFDYKRAKGDYIGTAPRGYMRQDNKLIKNPDEEEMINMLFDTYIKTKSTSKTLVIMNENGFSISKNGLLYALKSPTYRGDAKGFKCEPYLTPQKASKIDSIMEANYKERAGKNNVRYKFKKLFWCDECGCRMMSTFSTKPYIYKSYRCPGMYNIIKHKGFSYSEDKMERILLKELEAILQDTKIKADTESFDVEFENIMKKKNSLEAKLKRIGIRFEDGDISVEEYREKRNAINQELSALNPVAKIGKVEIPENWREIYDELDDDHKNMFWSDIIKEVGLTHDKSIPPRIVFF